MKLFFYFGLTVVCGLGWPSLALTNQTEAQETVQFLYEEYPPYTYERDGMVQGLIVDRVKHLSNQTGIKISWQESNFKRIVRRINKPDMRQCAAGYGKELFDLTTAWVSATLALVSNDTIAIRAGDLKHFEKHQSMDDILSDQSLRGAFIQGADYAGFDETLLTAADNRHLVANTSDLKLGMLVARSRAHFAMIDELQTSYLRENVRGADHLVSFRVEGITSSRRLYVACGSGVERRIRRELDDAITQLFSPATLVP